MKSNLNKENNRDLISLQTRDLVHAALIELAEAPGNAERNMVEFLPRVVDEIFGFGDFQPHSEPQQQLYFQDIPSTSREGSASLLMSRYLNSGIIKKLISRYYANINWSSRADIKNFLLVCNEIIARLEDLKDMRSVISEQHRYNIANFIRLFIRQMERDGYKFVDGKFVEPGIKSWLARTLCIIFESLVLEAWQKLRWYFKLVLACSMVLYSSQA